MTAPEWLTPGTKVATVTHHANYGYTAVSVAIAVRVGKRDVVLDDGQRFNVNRLENRPGGTWSPTSTVLVEADDPMVATAREKIRARKIQNHANSECLRFAHGGNKSTPAPTAAEVILALAPLTTREAEIRALLKDDQ